MASDRSFVIKTDVLSVNLTDLKKLDKDESDYIKSKLNKNNITTNI